MWVFSMRIFIIILLLLIFYTYGIYPCILYVFARLKKKRMPTLSDASNPESFYSPHVSLIIAAYNEEDVIEEKLKNSLELNYPMDKIEIIIGSDGSSDLTNDICREKSSDRFHFVAFEKRRGKASVVNDLVKMSKGEIIIFSDANTMFDPNSIQNMVKHFRDESIGGVCGRLELISDKKQILSGESVYWEYETFIKRMEGDIHSVMGANGGIYAIRKSLFSPISNQTIVDDFVISLKIVINKHRLVYENSAVGKEKSSNDLKAEIRRKIRIGAGNLQSLKYIYPLLLPKSGIVCFLFWSHKMVRWLVPLMLPVLYLVPFFSHDDLKYLILAIELSMLALALVGVKYFRKNKLITVNTYFFVINIAMLTGYLKYLLGLQGGIWEKGR